jgi:hypothetical protein
MHEHQRRGRSATGPSRTPSRSVTASAAELEILELQRTAGNAAVNRAMEQRPTVPVQRMEDNERKSPGYPPDLSGLTLSSRAYEPPTLSARAYQPPPRSGSRAPSESRDRGNPRAPRRPGNSGVRVAKKLSDVLPESEWWKLFMDPNDHATAQKKHPEDPGSYYDNDQSPGFRAGMVAAYQQILEKPENTLDSETYSDLHTTVTSTNCTSATESSW